MKVDKSKWEKKTLGEVACIYDSQRKPVAKSNRISGEYPYYGANGLQDYVSEYIFDGRYLLVGEDGGKWGAKEESTYIVEGKIWVNNHAHILQFENNVVDSFVRYYLNFADLTKYVTGSIVPKLTQANLKKITLLLPKSINEQQSIASELDAIQTMIDGYKAQLDDLDELAKSIFLDMFGDPVENPKGWKTDTLENIVSDDCSVTYGIVQPGDDVVDGVPVVRPVDLIGTYVQRETLKKVSIDISNSYKRTILKGNEILICVRGTTGIVSFASMDLKGCNVTRGIVPLSFDIQNIWFIYWCIKSLGMNNLIQKYTKGATLKQINIKDLRQLPFPIPPIELQDKFGYLAEAIETQKEKYKAQLADAEQLMAERMQYYFS